MRRGVLSVLIIFVGLINVSIISTEKPGGIQYASPIPDSKLNSLTSNIIIRPGNKLDKSSIDFSKQIIVTDKGKNRYSGTIILSSDSNTLIFQPDRQYKTGEIVYVNFLPGVKDESGNKIPSFEFSFTVTPLETKLDLTDYLLSYQEAEIRDILAKSRVSTALDSSLPSNFPKFKITKGTGVPADGYIFLSPSHFVDNKGFNLMIDNDGNLVYWQEIKDGVPVDFKVLPNGHLCYGSMYEFYNFTGGGPTVFRMMDSTFNVIDSFEMGNGYVAESHEFQLLSNGSCFDVKL